MQDWYLKMVSLKEPRIQPIWHCLLFGFHPDKIAGIHLWGNNKDQYCYLAISRSDLLVSVSIKLCGDHMRRIALDDLVEIIRVVMQAGDVSRSNVTSDPNLLPNIFRFL